MGGLWNARLPSREEAARGRRGGTAASSPCPTCAFFEGKVLRGNARQAGVRPGHRCAVGESHEDTELQGKGGCCLEKGKLSKLS